MKKRNAFWSGILGNIMDQYDVAIYAFLAPLIAPFFFKTHDPVVAVILTYGLMSLGLFTRPLGAFIFGQMAMNQGPKKTLIIILIGMTISTISMGLLPTYDSVGALAPVMLATVRAIQSIFAAGEVSVAAMFILEHEKNDRLGRMSSYYSCSTMVGIGIASLVATWVSASDNPAELWRLAFCASALTAIPALIMRLLVEDVKTPQKEKKSGLKVMVINRRKMLRIILTSSFGYMTYAVPFIFMNSFIPHILPGITTTQMLEHNNMLTILDIALILLFGLVVDRFRHQNWMAFISGLLACTIVPLFYFLPEASLWYVTLVRVWIIILGVAYSDPLNAWFFKLIDSKERYVVMGVGYALGTELLGRNTTVICWSLFYYLQNPIAPAIYIAIISLVAAVAVASKDATPLNTVTS